MTKPFLIEGLFRTDPTWHCYTEDNKMSLTKTGLSFRSNISSRHWLL